MDRLRCGFHQQYGMTETGAQSILRPNDHDLSDPGSLASAGCEAVSFDIRLVDDDDHEVPSGAVGEITCRGPAVMSGYWNLPEVSAETLRGGWMHTGDLAYRDERNLLHIVDRRNDMIITGGENVYPREVEAALAGHPAVPDAAVIGLPDARWGQVVTCVLRDDAPPDDELEAFLRERVAGYKVPRRWLRVAELPRNATGKVLKARLRDELTEPVPR
jgi:fatty-acyl-CoA synthase